MKAIKKNLMLIDDDQDYTFIAAKIINQTNAITVNKIFSNGLDALNFLKENASKTDTLPDIILLDLSMPVMDGWQFLEEFVHITPQIKKKITVYVCSNSISCSDIDKAMKISSVSDYIIKPVTKEKLIPILKEV